MMSAGTVTTGAVVSATVILKLFDAEFAWASVAVHVTDVVPSGNVDPLGGAQFGATVPSRISMADAVKLTGAPEALVASTVMFAGTVTVGGVVSRTVTVNVLVPVLPWLSVALQVTVVVVAAKTEPLGGVHVTGRGPSMLSVAAAVN